MRLGNADLRHGLAVETEHDAAELLIAVGDVEVDLVGDLGTLLGFGALGEEDEDEGEDQQSAGEEALEADHVAGMFVFPALRGVDEVCDINLQKDRYFAGELLPPMSRVWGLLRGATRVYLLR